MGILLQATLLPLLYSCDLKQSSSRSSVCGIWLKNANSPLQKCITSSYVQKQFNQTIQHVTFVSWAFNFTSALMYLRNDSEIIPEIWQVIHRSSSLLMNPLPIWTFKNHGNFDGRDNVDLYSVPLLRTSFPTKRHWDQPYYDRITSVTGPTFLQKYQYIVLCFTFTFYILRSKHSPRVILDRMGSNKMTKWSI